MANYILSCCSTADLSQEHFRDRDIHYVCFHYYLNGKPYMDDLGQSMPFDKFYQAMVDGAETSTSQVNADEFEAFWQPYLEKGLDVVHTGFACWVDGKLHLLHASSVMKKVILDSQTLFEYSKNKKAHTGVRVISFLKP